MSEFIGLDPKALSLQECYKLMIGSIVPRPIAFVSTCSPQGKLNLAPYSFFNAVCHNPPTVAFTTLVRGTDGALKDTLRNIQATGEYVINVVTEQIVAQANQTAAELAYGVSEFEAAGLTPAPSNIIQPPRVLESPINLECQLQQVIPVGDGGVGSGYLVLGTIVYFHVRQEVYQDGRILLEKLQPVARLAGNSYCPVRDVFDLLRP
jgi:flavin reductase (DIM6/NTAB) family NADH-FMN oxidoreductase RutF